MAEAVVYLVGAGPGDPGLITVKALDCIAKADVIVYDRLAAPKLLAGAKPDVELIYVGKASSRHTMRQEDINRVLVEKAKEGKVVTRLKGGDPLIFGRGGEEALELAKEGIRFEFVPGISSGYACAAYAGIPVTHRGLTSSVAFVTGHEDPTKDESDIAWDKLASGVGTIVFYMGVKNLPLIAEQLTKNGRDASTPVAVIHRGCTASQRTVTGTLATIVDEAEKAGIRPPSLIIVGEVVKLREQLAWYEKLPLFGKTVMVTRSRDQASALSARLEELGARVVEAPTIRIVPPESYGPLDDAISRLPEFDWTIFTSANAVDHFFARLREGGRDARALGGLRVAAIGPATAARLEGIGIVPDYVPKEYRAEGVLEGFAEFGVCDQRYLLPRALEAREVLPETLRERGAASVEVVPAYRTVPDEEASERIRELLAEGRVDLVTFTSSSTVKNFVRALGDPGPALLDGTAAISIGPITSETARELGVEVAAQADEYTIPGLVKAIVDYVQE
ncbi:MAG: uroporphyrinogen-III C-methyltransferase [Actinobacteria bacterium]|nr:MAG: uroporphyrinogen-III C-methyltransferase [Actinomycetota bacterium]